MVRIRPFVALTVALLLGSASAGCMQDDADGPQRGEQKQAQELILSLAMVDPPEAAEGAILNLTIDHVALYDEAAAEWVPLFERPHDARLRLDPGAGEPAFLAIVPILAGSYTRIEMVATAAEVVTEEGTKSATVANVACYAPVALGMGGEEAIVLEIYLSGNESLEETANAWRFQPAATGTLSDAPDGDAVFDEPDCQTL